MKTTKTGKPRCSQCLRVATHYMEGRDNINNRPIRVYHCDGHVTRYDQPLEGHNHGLITFRIHYVEKGDGKIIRGKRYNGKRSTTIKAANQTYALKKLRSNYVEDGIKEITSIEEVTESA